MLIDTFVNAIYLYDDKMLITFNYKDGTKTITFDEATTALANKDTGSNLDCLGAPENKRTGLCYKDRFFCNDIRSEGTSDMPFGQEFFIADNMRFAHVGTDGVGIYGGEQAG